MRACSFVPAATSLIYAMGLDHLLYGITFECPGDKPRVVRSALEGRTYTSAEIDRVTAEAVREGRSLYTVDLELLRAIRLDLVFTQSVCDVCQIGTDYAAHALASLDPPPRIVPLAPHRLADLFDDIGSIAQALGQPAAGDALRAVLRTRVAAIQDRLRGTSAPRRRVVLLEWMDPLYGCGHWLPDQIAAAGGFDPLGRPGGRSVPIAWDDVRRVDPEVLVIAPCGFDIPRAQTETALLARLPGWSELMAVRERRVYLADGSIFTQPSETLVDGIELLAALFHPDLFAVPARLASCVATPALEAGGAISGDNREREE